MLLTATFVKLLFLRYFLNCHCKSLFGPKTHHSEYVNIEITASDSVDKGRSKRSVYDFPTELQVLVKTQTDGFTLNLTFVKEVLKNPVLITLTDTGIHTEDVYDLVNNTQRAVYIEMDSSTVFTINRKEETAFDMHGTFIRDDELYTIEPVVQSQTNGNATVHRLSIVDDSGLEYERDYMDIHGTRNRYTNRHKRSTRHRRQQHQNLNVEYVVVTDYELYKKWYDDTDPKLTAEYRDLWTKYLMMEFYHHIVNGIDGIFKSTLSSNMEFHVSLTGLVISNTTGTTSWTDNQLTCPGCDTVNDQEVLYEFAKWRQKSLLPRLQHDHAALFTGYDLYYKDQGSRQTVGLSYLSMMCGNWSVAVIEDHRNALTSHVAAHELGHSLGAGHDGRDGTACSDLDMFLMAPQMSRVADPAKAHNPWSFSQCSLNNMLWFVDDLDRSHKNCLLNQPNKIPSPFNQAAGTTYSGDDQCRFTFGQNSSVCRDYHYHDWAAVCYGLACRNPVTQRCQMILPHEGTPCGNKQWCEQGFCVYSEKAAILDGICVMGDDPNDDCSNPNCANSNIRYGTCCYSCQAMSNPQRTTVGYDPLIIETLKQDFTSTSAPSTATNRNQDGTAPGLRIIGSLLLNTSSATNAVKSGPTTPISVGSQGITTSESQTTTPAGLLLFTFKNGTDRVTVSTTKTLLSGGLNYTTSIGVGPQRTIASGIESQKTTPPGLLIFTLKHGTNIITESLTKMATSGSMGYTTASNLLEIGGSLLHNAHPTSEQTGSLNTNFSASTLNNVQTTPVQSGSLNTNFSGLHVITLGTKKSTIPPYVTIRNGVTLQDISTPDAIVTQQYATPTTPGSQINKMISGSPIGESMLSKSSTISPIQSTAKNIVNINTQGYEIRVTQSTSHTMPTTGEPNNDTRGREVLTSSTSTLGIKYRRFFDNQLENMIAVFVSMTMFI